MINMGAGRRASVYIMALLLLFTGAACAELTNSDLPERTGVKIWKDVKLHGSLKTAESIDTNIYLQNTDTKVDSITVLSPLGGVEIPFHNGSLCADYRADIFMYGVNKTEDHVDQTLRGIAEVEFANFYKATLTDGYRIFTDRAANENSLRLKQKVNDARAGIQAIYGRMIMDVGYTNRLHMYDSTDPFLGPLTYQDKNHDSNIIDTTVSYRFLPKTYFLLENDIGFIHYYNTSQVPGSYYDEALFGFKGEWFSKANVNFRAGFKYQKYNQSQVIADKPYIGAVMKGGFDYTPRESDSMAFEFDREIYESTYVNMNYYVANLFGFIWKHNFTPKVYSNVSAAYQLHQYPSASTQNGLTAKRQDNFYQAGVALRYDVRKWVSLEAKYSYVNRISNFDVFNYLDNTMTVSATVGF